MAPSTQSLLYLASESPRRQELLHQIGIPHTVLRLPPVVGEDEPRKANEPPLAYVQRTALEKAQRAQQWLRQTSGQSLTDDNNHSDSSSTNKGDQPHASHTNLPILTADTTVALGDTILGKPVDAEHASSILSQLSGNTHTVYTAVVLATPTGFHTGLSTSRVTFKSLTQDEIAQYIDTRDCYGKAGADGIQGYAARFIRDLQGSYSGVMGLPLYETAELLRTANIIA
jgi:septum formation protein